MSLRLAHTLQYTKGYKYRTSNTFWCFTNIYPLDEVKTHRITLTVEGLLIVEAGYSSDGPSGPTIDTPSFIPGATGFHDPLYELLRCPGSPLERRCNILQPDYVRPGVANGVYKVSPDEKVVLNATHEDIRKEADRYLVDILLTHGMFKFRAKYVYDGLRAGGVSSARDAREVFVTPSKGYRGSNNDLLQRLLHEAESVNM